MCRNSDVLPIWPGLFLSLALNNRLARCGVIHFRNCC